MGFQRALMPVAGATPEAKPKFAALPPAHQGGR